MLDTSEHILRAQVLAAQWELQAVRAAIDAHQLTSSEGPYLLQVALRRYSAALRNFSDLTIYGAAASRGAAAAKAA